MALVTTTTVGYVRVYLYIQYSNFAPQAAPQGPFHGVAFHEGRSTRGRRSIYTDMYTLNVDGFMTFERYGDLFLVMSLTLHHTAPHCIILYDAIATFQIKGTETMHHDRVAAVLALLYGCGLGLLRWQACLARLLTR